MSMRLEIIGCSGAAPEPGGACSAYLVRGGGATVVLDCGPGALPRLAARLAPESVDAIFLSHMHQDHMLDLLPYTRALWRAGALEPGGPRVRLFAPPGGAAVLRSLASVFAKSSSELDGASEGTRRFSGPDLFSEVFDLSEYDASATVCVNGLTVCFVPMRHVGSAFGMRLTDGSALLAYTGDTGDHPGLDDLTRDAEVLLSEATLRDVDPVSGGRHGHLTAAEAGRAAARGGVRRLLLTHFSRPDLGWREDLAARAGAEFGGPVVAVRRDDVYGVDAGSTESLSP
jgi:ribonuclease BN (tRNA processing enzyme)